MLSRLTFFFPVFPFDSPEEFHRSVLIFHGNQEETLGRKGLIYSPGSFLIPGTLKLLVTSIQLILRRNINLY